MRCLNGRRENFISENLILGVKVLLIDAFQSQKILASIGTWRYTFLGISLLVSRKRYEIQKHDGDERFLGY